MKLDGVIKDKIGMALGGVAVEIKNSDFQTLYSAESDLGGYFSIDAPEGMYPFVTAVKEYGTKYLEYWCHNVDLTEDKTLDIVIDSLEIYGLNVFSVAGAYNSLMVYFRPMSLRKFQKGDADICPDIKRIRVCVDGQNTKILTENETCEYAGDVTFKAYLLQVENPNSDRRWTKLDISILDEDVNIGAAAIYNNG